MFEMPDLVEFCDYQFKNFTSKMRLTNTYRKLFQRKFTI